MDFTKVKEAADYIISKIRIRPKIAMVIGTGLGNFSTKLTDAVEIMYSDIPHFPESKREGYEGKIVFGKLGEKYVLLLCTRVHCFEGFSMQETAFPMWVLKELDVKTVIITNAAGAINEEYSLGNLVAIVDHIKLCGESPLNGICSTDHAKGQFDMTSVYDQELVENLKEVAYGMGMTVEDGVYAYMGGPQFETPAEIRALSVMGADLVGMSTVPEAIVAHYTGMKVLAVSCITNYAAGINGSEVISKEEAKEIGKTVSDKFESLMDNLIKRIDD